MFYLLEQQKMAVWLLKRLYSSIPELVGNLSFLMKRAGHLLSKMRFVSAQLDAYISNDVWLKNAKHANKMGKKLSEGLNANHKN
jgi:threonine aldolase